MKGNITALPTSLEQMTKLQPVSFTMKNGGQKELGFIAQDVERIYRDLVTTTKDVSATKSLNYIGLIAPTIKAVQELKADNDTLRRKLEAANDNVKSLIERISALKRKAAR
jgi:hypothetical protein